MTRPRSSGIRDRPPREAPVDAVGQEDSDDQSEHAASYERQYEQDKDEDAVDPGCGESCPGEEGRLKTPARLE